MNGPDQGAGSLTLSSASDRGMLRHFGVEGAEPQQRWQSVTPLALPVRRRRIDPANKASDDSRLTEVKHGSERGKEEQNAAASIGQALRQAGLRASIGDIRVQREPLSAKGARVEAFEPNDEALRQRFSKYRLWHAEITFDEPQAGPLIIGDGRYLGLGLMAPAVRSEGIIGFEIEGGLEPVAQHMSLTRALRRAVMARVADRLDRDKPLPTFFSGHEPNGTPARSGRHCHLAYVYDPTGARLLIVAPHILERRSASPEERRSIVTLEKAVSDLRDLRAGEAGRLRLSPTAIDTRHDRFIEPSRVWESVTPFRVTRHSKLGDARLALSRNLSEEARLIGLPDPHIEVIGLDKSVGSGLAGRARMRFEHAVSGPMLFGRDKHFGGGLFRCGPSS